MFVRYSTSVGLLLFAFVVSADASVQQGDHIKFSRGPGSSGGIFYIDNLSNGVGQDFDTFCVELEEHINFSSTYGVEAIAQSTNQTGKSLTSVTSWLYNSYLDQTLTFNYTSPTTAEANLLQFAIWKGMGYTDTQIGSVTGWNTTSYNTNYNSTGWANDFINSGWTGTGNIHIMNLRLLNSTGGYTSYAQDQLVRIAPAQGPLPTVPEPQSVLIWSALGLVGMTVSRLKR